MKSVVAFRCSTGQVDRSSVSGPTFFLIFLDDFPWTDPLKRQKYDVVFVWGKMNLNCMKWDEKYKNQII